MLTLTIRINHLISPRRLGNVSLTDCLTDRRPPLIYFKKKKTGGISFNAVVPLSKMDEKLCHRILQVGILYFALFLAWL